MERRQAGHAGRRDLLVRCIQENEPAGRRQLSPRRQGGKNRRARGHLHFRRHRATANCRRSSASSPSCPSTGGRAPTRTARSADIGETTLEPPLGSGPYRIKEFSPGHNIVYERVKDYWGKDLNVNVGRDNFDELRFEYFRDATVAIEAFKADMVDWRTENSAKNWATAYDFPAVTEKRVLLEEFPINNIGMMQAFAFNIRRDKFKDPRVRLAFNYAFDFEEMNKQIFFGQYKRIASYFEGTELAATGVPSGRELELLETVRDKVPPEVFNTPYTNPASGNPTRCATICARPCGCSSEAGYEVREPATRQRQDRRALHRRVFANAPLFERVFLFYKPALERLGITVSVRTVDEAQYENRLRAWDFDIIIYAWGNRCLPGNEQRGYWGSQAADQPGRGKRHRHQEPGGRRA